MQTCRYMADFPISNLEFPRAGDGRLRASFISIYLSLKYCTLLYISYFRTSYFRTLVVVYGNTSLILPCHAMLCHATYVCHELRQPRSLRASEDCGCMQLYSTSTSTSIQLTVFDSSPHSTVSPSPHTQKIVTPIAIANLTNLDFPLPSYQQQQQQQSKQNEKKKVKSPLKSHNNSRQKNRHTHAFSISPACQHGME